MVSIGSRIMSDINLDSLPFEILLYIWEYMNEKELFAISYTCKALSRTIFNKWVWNKRMIVVKPFRHYPVNHPLFILINNGIVDRVDLGLHSLNLQFLKRILSAGKLKIVNYTEARLTTQQLLNACKACKKNFMCELCKNWGCACRCEKVLLNNDTIITICVSCKESKDIKMLRCSHSSNNNKNTLNDQCIVVCLDCGQIQCGSCKTTCKNVISVDSLNEVVKCSACKKFSLRDNVEQCNSCNGWICLRCAWEANYKIYCEKCADRCTICESSTKFYCSRWTCIECGIIACTKCLNLSGMCEKCAVSTESTTTTATKNKVNNDS